MTTDPQSPPRDRLFALIASIPGSGTVDWCTPARALLDEIAAPPLSVLPPDGRAGVLREAADAVSATPYPSGFTAGFDKGARWATTLLRRLAAEERDEQQAQQGCACGEPLTLGTVHRTDGPCYIAETPQHEPEAPPCPHCPDGHTPPTRGSQPWSAWVTADRDADGQPMQITVARSAGAHVAESDAQWMRERLNARAVYAEHLPLDHPLRRECRCSEAGVCRRCAERPSVAAAPVAGQPPADTTGEEARVVRCSLAILSRPHAPHDWPPQPDMDPAHCPGHSFTEEASRG